MKAGNKILMTKLDSKVSVRKHYINKKELGLFLRKHRKISIEEIAVKLNIPITQAQHWFRMDKCFSIPDSKYWFKLKEVLEIKDTFYDKSIMEFEIKNNSFDMAKRIYHIDGKHPTLTTLTGGGQRKTITNGLELFYLNPNHCELLQKVPINYTNYVSDNQRYKMIGNGFTIDVIAFILSFIDS